MTMMFYRNAFFVVTLYSLLHFTLVGLTVADRKSSTFLAMKSSEGSDLCAVDEPTEVEWFPPHGSEIQCGLQCIRRVLCKSFNFNSLLGKCDQYETRPTEFSVIPGCTGYIFEGR